jgi:TonB-linked SusC/RagA family outer membrane protein
MDKLYIFKRILPSFCFQRIQKAKIFYSLTFLLLLSVSAIAQTTISGTVRDSKGVTLPGVSIRLKGTQTGTVTDDNGKYTIKAASSTGTLVFAYVGYVNKEAEINGKSTINITLDDDSQGLDEVVVVAFGAQKKSTLTGAVSQISADEIMKSPTPNPTNSLIGRLPGLLAVQTSGQPGADAASLKVRGVATYGANNAAIVVVDGIERPSFADVDQSEIETITVLKDAASTAIYGIRGANGIIVITTKQGKIGKPKVSYTGNIAQQTYTGLAVGLGAYDSAVLLNQSLANDGKAPFFTDTDIQKFQDGSDPLGHPDVKWFDYLTKKFYSQTQHNINISGGTKIAKYFVSAGYAFQDGIFKKFDSPYGINTVPNYNRYNFRSNLDFTLNKDLTVGIKLGGRFADRYQPAGLLSSSAFSYDTIEGMISRILQVPAYAYPVTLPDGRITANPNIGTNIWNPYAVLTRFGTRNDNVNTIESTFNLNYKLDFITKGLNFKSTFGYDSYYNNVERRNANWAAYVYNPATGTSTLSTDTRNRDEPLGEVQGGGVTTGSTNMNILAGFDYDRKFGKHRFGALALGTRQLIRTTGATAFTAPPKATQGIASRVTYNYDERYFAEFNAGYNGSENFPPGLRYGFFPAASAAWTLTNEPFWTKNNILNYLKIKGSYGLVGNDKISDLRFLYLTSYSNNSSAPFGNPQAISNFPTLFIGDSALGNDQLTIPIPDFVPELPYFCKFQFLELDTDFVFRPKFFEKFDLKQLVYM